MFVEFIIENWSKLSFSLSLERASLTPSFSKTISSDGIDEAKNEKESIYTSVQNIRR